MLSQRTGRPGFDRISGLVYTETSTVAPPPLSKQWASKSRGSTVSMKNFRNPNGAASMADMLWRVILLNLESLTPEVLSAVPWTLGEQLWLKIQQHDLVSVVLWQTFVSVYSSEIVAHNPNGLLFHDKSDRLPSLALQSRNPTKGLVPALQQILAPKFEWLVLLSIFDTPLARSDWIQIARLSNLSLLYVQNTHQDERDGQIDDVVIKAWANAADEAGAFPSLRLLMLRNQPAITLGVLEYLKVLPVLRVFHMTGPTFHAHDAEEAVQDSRWLWMSKSSLCLQLYAMWFSTSTLSRQMKELYDVVNRGGAAEQRQSKPLLKVITGKKPTYGAAPRQDQLWFELRADNVSKKRRPQDNGSAKISSFGPKKPRMRSTVQKSVGDVFDAIAFCHTG